MTFPVVILSCSLHFDDMNFFKLKRSIYEVIQIDDSQVGVSKVDTKILNVKGIELLLIVELSLSGLVKR